MNFSCDNITLYGDDGVAIHSGPRFYRCTKGGCGQLFTNGSIEKSGGRCHCGHYRLQPAEIVMEEEQALILDGTIATFDWEMALIIGDEAVVQMLPGNTEVEQSDPTVADYELLDAVFEDTNAPKVGKPKILVAIPGYAGIQPEAQESYAAMMYHSGRALSSRYDMAFKVITKRDQFRARNHIVHNALAADFDYLLMLDDDHIVPVDLVERLIEHMENRPEFGVIGALYYQRGGQYEPVVMKRLRPDVPDDWSFRFYRIDEDIIAEPGLHEVDIIGGGCMMFRTELLAKLMPPYFVPEIDAGTDIQICCRLRDAGVRIAIDTSIELGHLRNEKEIVTSRTIGGLAHKMAAINKQLHQDVLDYTGMQKDELERAMLYAVEGSARADKWKQSVGDSQEWADIQKYYQEHGEWHIVNLLYWNLSRPNDPMKEMAIRLLDGKVNRGDRVLDWGPGIGHMTIPFLEYGCEVATIEVRDAPTTDFLKWRVSRNIELPSRLWPCVVGPDGLPDVFMQYDLFKCALMISVIEHLHNPYEVIQWITDRMEPGGYLLCDYVHGNDHETDPQHLMRYDPMTFQQHMRGLGWETSPESMYMFIYRGK